MAFLVARAGADPDPGVRVEALRALAFHWPEETATASALAAGAAGDEAGEVREEAARLVGALAELRAF
ncbi:HEAT repeat domain-containing protein [Kitasatospora sp. NPDC048365]|uniref:HEAT repeat domain-containing protein n=1 Tax=Kitasatospora sp. NPDC048365 TaxID=3364050 RepID=UPI00371A2B23